MMPSLVVPDMSVIAMTGVGVGNTVIVNTIGVPSHVTPPDVNEGITVIVAT